MLPAQPENQWSLFYHGLPPPNSIPFPRPSRIQRWPWLLSFLEMMSTYTTSQNITEDTALDAPKDIQEEWGHTEPLWGLQHPA